MRGLFPTRDNLTDQISYYHLLLFMACLPFDMFYSHIILISFAIHCIIHFSKTKTRPVFNWQVLLLTSVFFVTVYSTFYSVNKTAAYNDWGRQITILLFPLLFCLMPFD